MSAIINESIFSKYVNVRVMLSIVLSVLLTNFVNSAINNEIEIANSNMPYVIFVFILYLIIYIVEAMPSIVIWFEKTFHASKLAMAK